MFQWTVHLNHAPNRFCHHAAVAVGNKLYSFGVRFRMKGNNPIGVFVFNTVSLLWKRLTPVTPGRGQCHLEVPPFREYHTAVLIEDNVYLWGGYPYCNVLYAFDVDAHRWFKPQVSGTVPQRRQKHSACVLGKVMYIHGGWTPTRTSDTNDLYKLDTITMVWSLINTIGTRPPPSSGHSATINGTKMFVFGGYNERVGPYENHYNTLRVFDTETNCWLKKASTQLFPEGRMGHLAFTYDGELYIFGGHRTYTPILRNCGRRDRKQHFSDAWKLSPDTFCWKKVEPKGKGPSPTSNMCCCMMGNRIILFGGDKTPDDLYVLDLSPRLKTLCKVAVIRYSLEQSGLPHNIRWELLAGTVGRN